MTRHAARTDHGGLRLVHTAYAVEARRSLESPAGFYRRYPMPAPPRRAWFARILLRIVTPLVWFAYAAALVFFAWLFGVFVLA